MDIKEAKEKIAELNETDLIALVRVWDGHLSRLHSTYKRFNSETHGFSEEYRQGWEQCADYIRLGDYVIENNPEQYKGLKTEHW